MVLQLDLGIKPLIKPTFENYVISAHNQQIIAHLQYLIKFPEDSFIYLWGEHGVGKSHLLQAVCETAELNNLSASYLSFNSIINSTEVNPEDLIVYLSSLLENLESNDIICLDDFQLIAGNRELEEQIFGFYNRIKDCNKVLIIASSGSVNSLDIIIPDLKSRLSHGVSYKLSPLDDDDKKKLLKTRAHERGMFLSDDLAKYLISRGKRDIAGLFEMLDNLDQESLRQKRKLSIPFARDVLFL